MSRAAGTASFPARFQLVDAANPCRRGCASFATCASSPGERARYLGCLSRPLLDRDRPPSRHSGLARRSTRRRQQWCWPRAHLLPGPKPLVRQDTHRRPAGGTSIIESPHVRSSVSEPEGAASRGRRAGCGAWHHLDTGCLLLSLPRSSGQSRLRRSQPSPGDAPHSRAGMSDALVSLTEILVFRDKEPTCTCFAVSTSSAASRSSS